MRPHLPDGRSVREIANTLIKPNDRLTSFERLQIYNQQYWFRLMACFSEDFPGVRTLIGERKFEKLATAYLNDCPSESFTLRNLGSRMEGWLRKHPEYVAPHQRLAIDMARLEWADLDAFDGPELPRMGAEHSKKSGGGTRFRLQPHLHLLDFAYPVDEWLLHIRGLDQRTETTSNAVLKFPHKARTRRPPLPRPERVFLAVYRLHDSVYFKRLTRDAFALLRALREGRPLAEAIAMSLRGSRRNVDRVSAQLREWFQNWSSLGWFARV